MDGEALHFPDVPRSQLESTIGDLIEQARRVLGAQARLRSLIAANHAVVDGLDIEQVLRHIVDAAVTLVDAQYGALGVVSPDGRLERFIHVGIAPDLAAQIGHLPEGHGLLGAVIDSDDPIRLEEIGGDPRSIGFPAHHPPMHSFLGVPIRVRGATFGNLYLTNRASGTFTAEDEELVTALAATAGVAIDNARLYDDSQRRQHLNAALNDVTAALLAPDTTDVFGVVADRVGTLAGADLVTVFVPTGTGQLRVETARGAAATSIEGTMLTAGDSVIARAIAGNALITTHADADALPFGEQLAAGSTIAVPLVVSGAPVGALCVTRGADGAPFSPEDMAIVSEFAGQAGLAVALAWARADRQRLDVIDDRARIARDLHDHVIQRLFGTGLGLQALAVADPPHTTVLEGHVAEIDAAINDIRTVVFTLQPRAASESARHRLLDLATELTPTLGATPRMTFAGPVDLVVVGVLADDVLAVVREALSNVARHAHAESTVVDITVTKIAVTVTIDDDGVGGAPQEAPLQRHRESGDAGPRPRRPLHPGTPQHRRNPGTLARPARLRDRRALMTRVFLVDDHEIVRRGIAQLIDAEPGLEVIGEADTVRAAYGRIAATRPDVVVMDVHLPDGNGIDLCRRIRSDDPDIRCLILTAYDDDTASVAAVMAGASGYVLTNVHGRNLLDGIHKIARGQNLISRDVTDRVHTAVTARAQAAPNPLVELTLRERQALQLITEGLTNRQIGERLGIAEKTVKNYVSGLLAKLGMERRTQVAAYGASSGTGNGPTHS